MRIAINRQVGQIRQRLGTPLGGEDTGASVATQDLGDFNIEEVRSVKRLARREDAPAYASSGGRLEENFENRGSIYDDQRLFLSARTAAADAGRGRRGRRRLSRFRNSSSVGRSSDWRTSRRR
jgi:hypothetical protein